MAPSVSVSVLSYAVCIRFISSESSLSVDSCHVRHWFPQSVAIRHRTSGRLQTSNILAYIRCSWVPMQINYPRTSPSTLLRSRGLPAL
ncbi:hypothetical protein L227DRAFT_228933 [Lentinus tigrinus ALCF2SS1-6]|uniref:Uncharacterized protein n=1 Tax=Lentinus tigrinus ALCF2SS1-6 TaxID=1328759 RepID=A0A5C2S3C6_9APHY|nr:hypothetical protein L227DRAFT_228933 [Lentinus tigrinus ALCF2SS1-6]